MSSITDIVDPIVPEVTQGAPYNDDYNEDKEFYRILYRPGYAVQARELTQGQTILQKQIQRFGDSIYTNGSLVTGGQVVYQAYKEKIAYINLAATYANTAIVANSFVGSTITLLNGSSSNLSPRAYVLSSTEQTASAPPTLVVKYLSGSFFGPNATIVGANTSVVANTAISGVSGNSSIVSIDSGVYYVNGYFAKVEPQTLILDEYDNNPTYSVGLVFSDSVVDENTDSSLLDPARGGSNFQAPGATRYKIDLQLTKRILTSNNNLQNYIELLRVISGNVTNEVVNPTYSALETTLARRTYDQSGNFTVRPFTASLVNHVPEFLSGTGTATANTNILNGTNTKFLIEVSNNSLITINNQSAYVNGIANGVLTLANNLIFGANNNTIIIQNPSKFSIGLSPGKAYVKGHEFQTIAKTYVSDLKGRTTANVSSYDLEGQLGNYIYITSANGCPDITNMETLDLHVVPKDSINTLSTALYANTKIGTARIRGFEYNSSSGATSNGSALIFGAYLFDVAISNTLYSLANVNSYATYANTAAGQYIKRANIQIQSKDNGMGNGNTFITQANFNTLVFPFPQQYIQAGSLGTISYVYKKMVSNVQFTAGVATVTVSSPETFVGSGVLSDLTSLDSYTIVVRNNQTSPFANGDIIPMVSGSSRSITISPITTATFNAGATSNNFLADIIYAVDATGSASNPRVKTLVSANTTNVAIIGAQAISSTSANVFVANGQIQIPQANVVHAAGNTQSLYISDIVKLEKVYDFLGNSITQANLSSAIDLSANYLLDNGQRDNYYDQGSIRLKAGVASPTGPLLICVDYYTHSGTSGFLSVDSYPNAAQDSGYSNISTFTSPVSGTLYALRDCIDFRPKKLNGVDGNVTITLVDSDTGSGTKIIEPQQNFISNFSYYLGRIDQLVLTGSKVPQFKVVPGVAGLYPSPPKVAAGDMLLYTLQIPPYTFHPSDVKLTYNNLKRYTMKDIGNLEKRIAALEYYTSLNLLEQASETLTITDSNGLNAFKNGILVDNFTGQQIGDVTSYDYACSMDFQNGLLYPTFTSNNENFQVNSAGSTNYCAKGGQVTLSYTTQSYISQDIATDTLNINPFSYATWVGTLTCYPAGDTWKDTVTRPQVLVNTNGQNDAWASANGGYGTGVPLNGWGTQYNDWNSLWFGTSSSGSAPGTSSLYQGYQLNSQGTSSFTPSVTSLQPATTGTVGQPGAITSSSGDSIVDVSIVPYMRPVSIIVKGYNLKPFSIFYPFLTGIGVQQYWIKPNTLLINLPISGPFAANTYETITSSSGGSGTLVIAPHFADVYSNTAYPIMEIINCTGSFNAGDTITGQTSGVTATISNTAFYSGNVASLNANTSQLNLDINASKTSAQNYCNSVVFIAKGTGAGQSALTSAYNNVSQVLSLSQPWTTTPDTTSVYSIGFPVTTPWGEIAGVLAVPNSNTASFFTGTNPVKLSTSSGNLSNPDSQATCNFLSQGLVVVDQPAPAIQAAPTPIPAQAYTPSDGGDSPMPATSTPAVPFQMIEFVSIGGVPAGSDASLVNQQGNMAMVSMPLCFVGNTKILMADYSEKNIRDIKPGDSVMSFGEDKRLIAAKVNKLHVHDSENLIEHKLVEITTVDSLKFHAVRTGVTLNHPFKLSNGEWKQLKDIDVKKELLLETFGTSTKIIAINNVMPWETLYNLEVDITHTYIANGLRVHNGDDAGGSGGDGPVAAAEAQIASEASPPGWSSSSVSPGK